MHPRPSHLRHLTTSISLALLLVAAGCSSDPGDTTEGVDRTSTTAEAPTSQPTSQPATTESATSSSIAEVAFVEPEWWIDERRNRRSSWAHLAGDIERAAGQSAPLVLEPGRYTTGQLGTEITFSTDGLPLTLIQENPGLIEFGKTTLGSGVILLMRPSSVYDGDARYDPNGIIQRRAVTSPVPEDIGPWLASAEGLVVTNEQQLTVDGAEARSYDVVADSSSELPFPCQLGPHCVLSFRAGGGGLEAILFDALNLTRVVEIEQPGTDLIVFANATVDEFADLEPILDDLLDSFELGDVGPSPFEDNTIWEWNTYLPPGTYRFGGIGTDIEVEIDATRQILNEAGALCLGPTETEEPGDVCLIEIVGDVDGAALTTADDAIAAIETLATGVESLGPEPMLGTAAVAVQVDLAGPQPIFHHAPPPGGEPWPQAMWDADEHTVVWLVETADGLWAVTAQTPNEENLPRVTALARALFSDVSLG